MIKKFLLTPTKIDNFCYIHFYKYKYYMEKKNIHFLVFTIYIISELREEAEAEEEEEKNCF